MKINPNPKNIIENWQNQNLQRSKSESEFNKIGSKFKQNLLLLFRE